MHATYKFYVGLVESLIDYAGHEIPRALGKAPFPPRRLPTHLRQPWRWFGDLNETRTYDRHCKPVRAERLPNCEIAAWAQVAGVTLEPWHAAAIWLIDEIYVDTFNDEQPSFAMPSMKLTPQLFDVLFRKKQ